jgi:hypothetical protein
MTILRRGRQQEQELKVLIDVDWTRTSGAPLNVLPSLPSLRRVVLRHVG